MIYITDFQLRLFLLATVARQHTNLGLLWSFMPIPRADLRVL